MDFVPLLEQYMFSDPFQELDQQERIKYQDYDNAPIDLYRNNRDKLPRYYECCLETMMWASCSHKFDLFCYFLSRRASTQDTREAFSIIRLLADFHTWDLDLSTKAKQEEALDERVLLWKTFRKGLCIYGGEQMRLFIAFEKADLDNNVDWFESHWVQYSECMATSVFVFGHKFENFRSWLNNKHGSKAGAKYQKAGALYQLIERAKRFDSRKRLVIKENDWEFLLSRRI